MSDIRKQFLDKWLEMYGKAHESMSVNPQHWYHWLDKLKVEDLDDLFKHMDHMMPSNFSMPSKQHFRNACEIVQKERRQSKGLPEFLKSGCAVCDGGWIRYFDDKQIYRSRVCVTCQPQYAERLGYTEEGQKEFLSKFWDIVIKADVCDDKVFYVVDWDKAWPELKPVDRCPAIQKAPAGSSAMISCLAGLANTYNRGLLEKSKESVLA